MFIEICVNFGGKSEAMKKKNGFYPFIHSLKKYLSRASHVLDIVPALKMQEDRKGSYPLGCSALMKKDRKQANKERNKNTTKNKRI